MDGHFTLRTFSFRNVIKKGNIFYESTRTKLNRTDKGGQVKWNEGEANKYRLIRLEAIPIPGSNFSGR